MRDVERVWAVAAGSVGLVCFVAGSLAVAAPRIDQAIGGSVGELAERRGRVIAGSLASITGAALLLWPLSYVASSPGAEVWRSLAVFSMATWVFGFMFLAAGSLMLVATIWRTGSGVVPADNTSRTLLDLSHIAIWSFSAPIGALSVAATTVTGMQAGLFGPWVVAAAVLKWITVVIEVAGAGRTGGWNAGGWAYGSSGYATVLWFALLLLALL